MNEYIAITIMIIALIVGEVMIFCAGQYSLTHQEKIHKACDC